MKVKIIPYCEVDGIRTFSDSEIKGLWERFMSQGSAPTFTKGMYFRDANEWLYRMKYCENHLYVCMVENEIMGCFWLNGFQEKFCQMHYFIYKAFFGKGKDYSIDIMRQIFSWIDGDGKPLFDMLLGITPKDNSLAVRFMKKCGWKLSHEIPCAWWDEKEQVSKPGYISYITLADLEDK